jgi:hypothetical protein
MKQILTMKGRSSGIKLMMVLVVTLVGLGGTPAIAQTDPFLDPDQFDWGTGCPWYMYEDCATTPEDIPGAASAPSTASPTASPSASATASASAPATASASAPAASASAAQDQYKELPDTAGKTVAPAETTQAKQLPNTDPGTDGKAAAPANTTEATGPPETNRNISALPLMFGFGALLVGGGLLARRLFR